MRAYATCAARGFGLIAVASTQAGDDEGSAGEVVVVQAFAEEEIGEHGDEYGLQVEQHAGAAGAERLDAAVVEIIHQRAARAGDIGERQQAVRYAAPSVRREHSSQR